MATSTPASPGPSNSRQLGGTALGLASAVGYTAANIGLRSVTDCDPIWVSCVKAWPTIVLVLPFLVLERSRHDRPTPSRHVLGLLVGGSLVSNILGNAVFQWSLGVIGMALAVPIMLGTIIVAGTLMGRALLGESVTPRTALGVLLLVVAIAVLSLGGGRAAQVVAGQAASHSGTWIAAGVAAACLAGTAYALLAVIIRYGVKRRASVTMTLFVVSTVGGLSLAALTGLSGGSHVWQSSPRDYTLALVAGLANAFAFLTLTKAFQLTNMVYINALNGSQAAMAAVAGVVVFQEPLSPALGIGIGITMIGVILLEK